MYLSVFDSFMEVFKAHASWIRCLKKKKKYMPVKLKLWEKMQEKSVSLFEWYSTSSVDPVE